MDTIQITPFVLAKRFEGQSEVSGSATNHQILAMLKLDDDWPHDDSVPWCSAFVNYVAWLLGLNRTRSLRARSWLREKIVTWEDAKVGFDLVVLKRGHGMQPGPDVIDAPGHVGFFAGWLKNHVKVLGGNQKDSVNIATYSKKRILGIRRLTA